MSEKTMLDIGANLVLEGDPLGLCAIEEKLAWRTTGPLPDWLEGSSLDEDGDGDAESCELSDYSPTELPAESYEPLPETSAESDVESDDDFAAEPQRERDTFAILDLPEMPPAVAIESPPRPGPVAPSLHETVHEMLAESSHDAGEDLVSINEILRFVDEPTPSKDDSPEGLPPPESPVVAEAAATEPVAATAPATVPSRRCATFEELIDSRLCLLTEVAERLWAVPLDRVVSVKRQVSGDKVFDLHERQEGKKRKGDMMSIELDRGVVLRVDRVLGPRSFGWEAIPLGSGDLPWELARTFLGGEQVGLIDDKSLTVEPL